MAKWTSHILSAMAKLLRNYGEEHEETIHADVPMYSRRAIDHAEEEVVDAPDLKLA